jgi:hypothetical protein
LSPFGFVSWIQTNYLSSLSDGLAVPVIRCNGITELILSRSSKTLTWQLSI